MNSPAPFQVLPPLPDESIKPAPAPKPKRATAAKAASRIQILNAFVNHEMGKLKRAEIAVWLALYRDTKWTDGMATTPRVQLANRANIDKATVSSAIKELERIGLVQVVYRGSKGRGNSRYRVFGRSKMTPE